MEGETQIGYASYSRTERQASRETQLVELGWAGCGRIEEEQVHGSRERTVLASVLNNLRQGDVFTVTKMDRIARSTQEVIEIVQAIERKGAALRILSLNITTGTAGGGQMLQVLAAAAELERTAVIDKWEEVKRIMQQDAALATTAQKLQRDELALANLERIEALIAKGRDRKQIARELGVRESVVLAASRELSSRKMFGSGKLEGAITALRQNLVRLKRARLSVVRG